MNPVVTSRRTSFEETLLSARRTMLLSEILKLAMDSFRAAKTRFFLTALGMVIGTASVILVVTIGMTGKALHPRSHPEVRHQLRRSRICRRRRHRPRARALYRLPHPRRRKGRGRPVAQRHVLLAGHGHARPHQLRRRRRQGHAGPGRQPPIRLHPQPHRHRRPLLRRHRRHHPPEVRRGQRGIRQGALRRHLLPPSAAPSRSAAFPSPSSASSK